MTQPCMGVFFLFETFDCGRSVPYIDEGYTPKNKPLQAIWECWAKVGLFKHEGLCSRAHQPVSRCAPDMWGRSFSLVVQFVW